MGKRILLFVLTNIAVVVVLSIVLSVLGIGNYIGADGNLQFGSLAVFCLVWGMGGAFISLQLSRWMAKRAMGIQLVDGLYGSTGARLALQHRGPAGATQQPADAGSGHLPVARSECLRHGTKPQPEPGGRVVRTARLDGALGS